MKNHAAQQSGQPGLWQQIDKVVTGYWIPFGLAVFLSGFFWAASRHNLIVITNYMLLLPALFSVFSIPRWRAALTASPLLLMTAAFLLYMSSGSIIQQGLEFAEFYKWSFFIILFIFGIGASLQISEARLGQLLLLCALTAAGAGCYAIYRDIQAGQFWLPDYRLMGYGTLYNSLRSGFLFGAFATMAGWYAAQSQQPLWVRMFALAIAGMCVLTTLLTGSRAPLLGLFAAAAWLSVSSGRWDRFFLLLVGAAAVAFLAWERLSERGVSLRPEIWGYVWELCKQHPWLGDGMVRSALEVPTSEGPKYNTHNIFLTILYYGGIIGVVQFMAIVGATFYLSWRDRLGSTISQLAALLQLYSIVALQFDGVNLITRPADFWVTLWLPIALHLFGRMHIIARQRSHCIAP